MREWLLIVFIALACAVIGKREVQRAFGLEGGGDVSNLRSD
jgi:hypothetical protein